MAVKAAEINVGTVTPVLVSGAESGFAQDTTQSLVLKPTAAIQVGPSNTTVAAGYTIAAGAEFKIDRLTDPLYAIAAVATVVRTLQVGVA